MISICLLYVITAISPGPRISGCACGSYAWSDDAASCLIAPAGLVRMTESEFSVYSSGSDLNNSGLFAAAAVKMESIFSGAGIGWIRSETESDTLDVMLSLAKTVRGDPVGFMEGVFGPSISLGASLGFTMTGDDNETENMLSASFGFQFSVFPTIAIGLDISSLRLYGDRLHDREIGYGFTTVLDREFRGHFSVTEGRPALGFDMDVNDWLSVRTGSDGSSWNSGVSFSYDIFRMDLAVLLGDGDCQQVLGLTISPGKPR